MVVTRKTGWQGDKCVNAAMTAPSCSQYADKSVLSPRKSRRRISITLQVILAKAY